MSVLGAVVEPDSRLLDGPNAQHCRLSTELRADVLFFEGLGHVGLYVGRGRMVHAPETGRNVEVVRLAGSNYGERLIGARRIATT